MTFNSIKELKLKFRCLCNTVYEDIIEELQCFKVVIEEKIKYIIKVVNSNLNDCNRLSLLFKCSFILRIRNHN